MLVHNFLPHCSFSIWCARLLIVAVMLCCASNLAADDGYRAWLRYDKVQDSGRLEEYRHIVRTVVVTGDSPTMKAAGDELSRGLKGLLAADPVFVSAVDGDGAVIVGTPRSSAVIASHLAGKQRDPIGGEGYYIESATVDGHRSIIIAANEDIGALYGVFHFLRLMQTHQP